MKKEADTTITIDTRDYKGMIDLMDRADEFSTALFGKTSDGETTMISINKDNITIETFQHNGWTRQDIYYRDCTHEELYSR